MTKAKQLEDSILMQISIEKENEHTKEWTEDYLEGFIDGLGRAIELIKEL